MRVRWLVLVVAILALTGIAAASTVQCATLSGFSTFLLAGPLSSLDASSGCYEGDVFYSGFSYSSASTPDTTVSATFGFTTGVFSGLALGGNWTPSGDSFNFSYTESLCTIATCGFNAAPLTVIWQADAQESPGGATANLINTITSVNGTVNANTGPGNLSVKIGESSVTSITFMDSYTSTGSDTLTGVTNDVYETLVPEPGTMMLMGGALLGLGALIRKRCKTA